MSTISRLKDPEYYIDFDEACVYHGKEVVAEITSETQLEMLRNFALKPHRAIEHDAIEKTIWNVTANNLVSDSTVYSLISKIRRIHPKIKESIKTVPKGYIYCGQEMRKNNFSAYNIDPSSEQIVVRSVSFDDLLDTKYDAYGVASTMLKKYHWAYIGDPNTPDAETVYINAIADYLKKNRESFKFLVNAKNEIVDFFYLYHVPKQMLRMELLTLADNSIKVSITPNSVFQ